MLFFFLFFIQLITLFFLSKQLTKKLSLLFHRLTRSSAATIHLMAFLFFPGTVIHELAHFLVAELLFVRVHHIELLPKLEGNYVKMGSVSITQTDIFRRFLIGVAPLIVGIGILLGLLFFAAQNTLFGNQWFIVLMLYSAFEIGNTMFSSKKDMEGALELLGVVTFFGLVFYFLGLRLPAINLQAFFEQPLLTQVFQQGNLFLLVPLGIDILCIALLSSLPFLRYQR